MIHCATRLQCTRLCKGTQWAYESAACKLHSPRSGFARTQDSTRINHCWDSANSGCFVERGRCTHHAKILSRSSLILYCIVPSVFYTAINCIMYQHFHDMTIGCYPNIISTFNETALIIATLVLTLYLNNISSPISA
jgi:hypothetical protein